MSRPMLSSAGAALLRALLRTAEPDQGRIFLTDLTTTDWHSLTFAGERHVAGFAVHGAEAMSLAKRWIAGIEDADLPIGNTRFVAEITVTAQPEMREDESVFLQLEALTLES